MRFNNKVALETTMAGTTQVFSEPFFLENVYAYSFHHYAIGATPGGSLQLQISNQKGRDEVGTDVTKWVNLDSAITISATDGLVNKDGVGYRWARFSYTPASGVGTLTVIMNTKGV